MAVDLMDLKLAQGDYGGGEEKFNETTSNKTRSCQTFYPEEEDLELLSKTWQNYLEFLYSLTAITSFLLNALTVIVLARKRQSQTQIREGQSQPFRKYLINLSVSDLLMSMLSIPFTYNEYMLGQWTFPEFLCPIVRFVVTLSVFVSVATMTVIGINRHSAIVRGNTGWGQWTERKNLVIGAIWLLGFGISSPEWIMNKICGFEHRRKFYNKCESVWTNEAVNNYTVFLFLLTCLIPLLLLGFLYTKMARFVLRSTKTIPGERNDRELQTICNSRHKSIKMLVMVVILFVVSWVPLQTYTLIVYIFPSSRAIEPHSAAYKAHAIIFFSFHGLAMAHSCFNPLIYCFMCSKFREELLNLLRGRRARGKQGEYQHRLVSSSMTGRRGQRLDLRQGEPSEWRTALPSDGARGPQAAGEAAPDMAMELVEAGGSQVGQQVGQTQQQRQQQHQVRAATASSLASLERASWSPKRPKLCLCFLKPSAKRRRQEQQQREHQRQTTTTVVLAQQEHRHCAPNAPVKINVVVAAEESEEEVEQLDGAEASTRSRN